MDAQLRLIPRAEAHRADARTDAATRARARAGATPSDASAHDPAEAPVQWRIDDGARERGRAGISRARQALQAARASRPFDHHHTTAA